jgi:hypothetical protein
MPHQYRPIPSQSGHHLAEITPVLLGCSRIGLRVPVAAKIERHRTAVRHQIRRHLRPRRTVVATSVHQEHSGALAAEVHPRQDTAGHTHPDLGPQHKPTLCPSQPPPATLYRHRTQIRDPRSRAIPVARRTERCPDKRRHCRPRPCPRGRDPQQVDLELGDGGEPALGVA